ncbi:MAG: CoA-binding protein [Methanobacteriota archaeon]|uniref:CoA-binding protein n=1 Tax=Marine Group III euryarchaeote TaxID=2173149 RepID=A0A7J4GX94_9ARCH|nr:MAG: CoA-binding protein [Euryarchaeota archaeon]HIF37642.1 CoA-binding protein [Marine Group III euryarchaeote]
MVLQKMKEQNVRIALIGASNDSSKFGNQIYLDLRNKGYHIVPINPKENEIEGDKAYASIDMMDSLPDIVNFVVPPQIAIKVAQKAIDLGITHLWFQPGSESDELEELLRKNHDIKYLINSCIMVETR